MEGEKGSPGSSTADGPRTEADKFQPLPTDWWDDESDDDVNVGRDRREVDATDRQGSTQGPHPAEEQRRAEQTIETASGRKWASAPRVDANGKWPRGQEPSGRRGQAEPTRTPTEAPKPQKPKGPKYIVKPVAASPWGTKSPEAPATTNVGSSGQTMEFPTLGAAPSAPSRGTEPISAYRDAADRAAAAAAVAAAAKAAEEEAKQAAKKAKKKQKKIEPRTGATEQEAQRLDVEKKPPQAPEKPGPKSWATLAGGRAGGAAAPQKAGKGAGKAEGKPSGVPKAVLMPLPGGKGKGEAPPAGSSKSGRGGVGGGPAGDVASWPAMPSSKKAPPVDPDYIRDTPSRGRGELWTGAAGPKQPSFTPAKAEPKQATEARKPEPKAPPASKNKPKTGQGMNLSDMLGDFTLKSGGQKSKQSKKQTPKPVVEEPKGKTYVSTSGEVVRERGKEREVKKAKKPTRTKKLILQERGIKGKYHKARELQQRRMELLADVEAANDSMKDVPEEVDGEAEENLPRDMQEATAKASEAVEEAGEGKSVEEGLEETAAEPTEATAEGEEPSGEDGRPGNPENGDPITTREEAPVLESRSEEAAAVPAAPPEAIEAETALKKLEKEEAELWAEVEEEIDQLETQLDALREEIGEQFDRDKMNEIDLATRRERTTKMEERANHKSLFRSADEYEAAKKLMVKERAIVMYLEREESLGDLIKLEKQFGKGPSSRYAQDETAAAASFLGSDAQVAAPSYTTHLIGGLRNGWKAGPAVIREYVQQVIDPDLNEATVALLQDLTRFQQRLKEVDPHKAAMKKRYFCGLREVLKGAKRGKLKAVIIATNIDKIEAEGGLDDQVKAVVEAARTSSIPVVFALNRNKLGKAIGTSHKISTVGIINYDGAHVNFKNMLKLQEASAEMWRQQTAA